MRFDRWAMMVVLSSLVAHAGKWVPDDGAVSKEAACQQFSVGVEGAALTSDKPCKGIKGAWWAEDGSLPDRKDRAPYLVVAPLGTFTLKTFDKATYVYKCEKAREDVWLVSSDDGRGARKLGCDEFFFWKGGEMLVSRKVEVATGSPVQGPAFVAIPAGPVQFEVDGRTKVEIAITAFPPSKLRCNLDRLPAFNGNDSALHDSVEWNPLGSQAATRSVFLAGGVWSLSCNSDPMVTGDKTEAGWTVSSVTAKPGDLELKTENSLATAFVNQGSKAVGYLLISSANLPSPADAKKTLSNLQTTSVSRSALPVLDLLATDLAQLLAQVAYTKARGKASDLLSKRLRSTLCEAELRVNTELGRALLPLTSVANPHRPLLVATCAALDGVRLEDLAGSGKSLILALRQDALTLGFDILADQLVYRVVKVTSMPDLGKLSALLRSVSRLVLDQLVGGRTPTERDAQLVLVQLSQVDWAPAGSERAGTCALDLGLGIVAQCHEHGGCDATEVATRVQHVKDFFDANSKCVQLIDQLAPQSDLRDKIQRMVLKALDLANPTRTATNASLLRLALDITFSVIELLLPEGRPLILSRAWELDAIEGMAQKRFSAAVTKGVADVKEAERKAREAERKAKEAEPNADPKEAPKEDPKKSCREKVPSNPATALWVFKLDHSRLSEFRLAVREELLPARVEQVSKTFEWSQFFGPDVLLQHIWDRTEDCKPAQIEAINRAFLSSYQLVTFTEADFKAAQTANKDALETYSYALAAVNNVAAIATHVRSVSLALIDNDPQTAVLGVVRVLSCMADSVLPKGQATNGCVPMMPPSVYAGDVEVARRAIERAGPYLGALAGYAASLPGKEGQDTAEAREARARAIESFIDASTRRQGRDRAAVVSVGALVGFGALATLTEPSKVAEGAALPSEAQPLSPFVLTMPMGFSFEWLPRSDCVGGCPAEPGREGERFFRGLQAHTGVHFRLSLLDLAQFLNVRNDGSIVAAKPDWANVFSVGGQLGLQFGVPEFSLDLSLDGRWTPAILGPAQIGGESTDITRRGAWRLGVVIGTYIPFFDFN